MSLGTSVVAAARAAGTWIVTAESCTGGLVAAAITEAPGASKVFDRGYVTYSNNAKIALLGVRHETIEAHGAVSEPVARQMAEGALARSGAALAVAITGIAGPGGSEHKPEGRVCFGLARQGRETRASTVDFGAQGRAQVRRAATDEALRLLLAALDES